MSSTQKRIALGDLNVDLGNFRIGEFDSSRDAYKAMIEEQKESLVNLAEDILAHGLSPAELLIVGPDPDNKSQFVVFEGNRRITALKLLQAPALSAGTAVHADFVKLSKQYMRKPIKHLECLVVPDKDSALLWIERKHAHLGGRGIDGWGAPAKHRLDVYRNGVHRPSMAVIAHLEGAGKLPSSLKKDLLTRTTNVDRVMQMPYFETTLGVTIADDGQVTYGNGDSKAGDALLLEILRRLADKKFVVDNIKRKEQRKDFIDEFINKSVAAPPANHSSSTKSATAKATKPSKAPAKKADAAHRVMVAPRTRETTFVISDPRLSGIYQEMRGMDSERFSATGAVMVRVFLELSTEYFLKSFKVPRPQKHQNKGWSDSSISLKEKIAAVLGVIDPPGQMPELKLARQGLTDKDRMHSIDELHTFVHALNAAIVGKEVRTIWDRWHKYLALLYKRLQDAGH